MKIVHVVRQFAPSVGGLEDSVRCLAAIQRAKLGLDTKVVTLDRVFSSNEHLSPKDTVDGVPVRRIPWRGSTRYPLAPSVLQHILDADLVHVHAIDFFFDFLAATRAIHGKRMIASTHGGFFHSGAYSAIKNVWFQTLTRASIHAYERIVACSHNDADRFRAVSGKKLITIENGITQEKFLDASAPDPRRTIVSFGRFARHKRIDLLFPLLRALKARNKDWSLIIAGRPSDLTEADLLAAAKTHRVEDAVRFVIDPDDRALRDVLRDASYFACLSEHEGFGIAAVEALSAGLYPILSPIPPFRRLVEQTGIGLITADTVLDDAAARIEAIHTGDSSDWRAKAMQAASSYDWNDVAKRYASLYREVVPGYKSADTQ